MCHVTRGILLALLLFHSTDALAQDPTPEKARLAYQVQWPGVGIASGFPGFSWDANPASMMSLPSTELTLAGGESFMGGSFGVGNGYFKLGAGLDYLSQDSDHQFWRFGFNTGIGAPGRFALAFLWQPTWGDSSIDGRHFLSLGALVHAGRTLSVGLSATNLSREVLPDGDRAVRYGLGVALRPGVDWVSVEANVRLDEDVRTVEPGLLVGIRPVRGVHLGIDARLREVDDNWGVGVGGLLTLSFGSQDVAAGVQWGQGGDASFALGLRTRLVQEKSVLSSRHHIVKWNLSGAPELGIAPLFGATPESFLDLRRRMASLALDPRVDGVLLMIGRAPEGWASTQELAESIASWRRGGKKVVAYVQTAGNREYYLAAQADVIVVSPAAAILFTGVHSTMTFLTRLMEKVGIQAQFVWIGKYKSFRETFTRTKPTPEYEEAHVAMLDQVFRQLMDGVAAGRNVPVDKVREWVDAGPVGAKEAVRLGMADHVATLAELEPLLKTMGLDTARLTDRYPLAQERRDEWLSPARIGVIVASGTIMSGTGGAFPGMSVMGEDDILSAIRRLSTDPSIRGVLLRIDSPGGSAQASENMNRALVELARVKPLVVSMGNVAASGGYYMAVPGKRVFAMPGTVTGSIGIWAGKIVLAGLLDWLGIDRVHYSRGKYAELYSSDRAMSEDELSLVQTRLQELYDLFVGRVAEGRSMTPADVESVAQGRVWSGAKALEHHLVDELGGCFEALQWLCGAAGIPQDVGVELVYTPSADFGRRLQKGLTGMNAESSVEQFVLGLWERASMEFLWTLDPWLVFQTPGAAILVD